MSDPVYVSRSRVAKVHGVTRRATLADGTEVTMGVHGPIKEAFGLHDAEDHPLPVDFLVAAAAT
jgi:hypothetical protein